jgi:hypothetical protein
MALALAAAFSSVAWPRVGEDERKKPAQRAAVVVAADPVGDFHLGPPGYLGELTG